MKKRNIFIQLFVILAILFVVNLIVTKMYFRFDFTEDRRYTFSEATKEVLDDLEGVITVTAYFSEDLPSQLLQNKQDFEEQLVEYENRSDGNVVYEFINPNESEELEREAQTQGIRPVMINVSERDQTQQLRAYMGAVLKMDDRTEVIPFIQPGAPLEYALTTAIKKISIVDKPKIGVIQGYGEPSLQAIPQLLEQLNVLYEAEPFTLRDTSRVPSYYRSLLWINPRDSISPADFMKLDTYLNNGGGLFIAYSNIEGDLQQGLISKAQDTGMQSWLGRKGITLGDHVVVDASCASVTVQQRSGFFTINSQKEFPYFPEIVNFSESPVTKGLETVIFQFSSALTFNARDTSAAQIPLIFSSGNSGLLAPPTYIDIEKQWTPADFQAGEQMLAAGLDGIGNISSRLVFIANGDFCVNGEGQQMQQLNPDNINLASNAVDWISDDTGLINLRTKVITSRPLDQVEDTTRNLLKWGNVLSPIILLLVYAFIRRQRNSRKRQRWMQGNYQ